VFAGALAFFCFVLLLVDLLANLWQYLLEGASLGVIARISFLYIPKAVSFSIPLAVLFGAAFTLSSLYASNELTVIFASGVSLLRFTLPLLIFQRTLVLRLPIEILCKCGFCEGDITHVPWP